MRKQFFKEAPILSSLAILAIILISLGWCGWNVWSLHFIGISLLMLLPFFISNNTRWRYLAFIICYGISALLVIQGIESSLAGASVLLFWFPLIFACYLPMYALDTAHRKKWIPYVYLTLIVLFFALAPIYEDAKPNPSAAGFGW